MGLKAAVAAPFKGRGTSTLPESEFVVALSLDRDWFSPDQAKRLVDVATGHGLVTRDGDDLVATFEISDVEVPDGFVPDESLLARRSTFELVLSAAIEAGTDKREAVAAINRRQAALDTGVEAAAVVFARSTGLNATAAAKRAREELNAPDLQAVINDEFDDQPNEDGSTRDDADGAPGNPAEDGSNGVDRIPEDREA